MSQNASHRPRDERSPGRQRTVLTAADLVATGAVTAEQAYAATIVLARLHDRRIALTMTLEEMCEVLGYLGAGRRPRSVPSGRLAPAHLRGDAGILRPPGGSGG